MMARTHSNSRTIETQWLDLRSLAGYASISERTAREWIHRPVDPLPAVRVGTKILVKRGDFDRWLGAHPLIAAETLDVGSTVDEILADLNGAN